jgi:hypothetical protein
MQQTVVYLNRSPLHSLLGKLQLALEAIPVGPDAGNFPKLLVRIISLPLDPCKPALQSASLALPNVPLCTSALKLEKKCTALGVERPDGLLEVKDLVPLPCCGALCKPLACRAQLPKEIRNLAALQGQRSLREM